jgi:hypothetical protein
MTPETFVTADDIAEHLKVTRRQVLEMARKGLIPAHPLIGQGKGARCMWRFRLSEVADAVARNVLTSQDDAGIRNPTVCQRSDS